MSPIKSKDIIGGWLIALSLLLISLILGGTLIVVGWEMVTRLDAEITRGVKAFHLSQKESIP
ncbi:MAG: hypothetical protein ACE5J1_02940 [Nitrospiria bacterium]